MHIRKTRLDEVEQVLEIIQHGRHIQAMTGNKGQWPDHYPARQHIEADILKGESYVCVSDQAEADLINEGTLLATLCIQESPDPTYANIDGQWLNDNDYVTVHRIATNQKVKGAASFAMQYVVDKYHNIRIDTHEKNKAMLAMIAKFNFIYCGIVEVRENEFRKAFQLSRK